MAEPLHLIEPVPIDDDLCTGLALIEDLGFGARLVLYADQSVYESPGRVHQVVKRKLVVPRPGLVAANRLLRRYLAGASPRPLRLVK